MVQLFLEDAGRLHDSTEVLSVGAGNERILYWLADRVGRVVPTDVYGDGAFASREAEMSMLEDPRTHAPWPYREDHLEVPRRWTPPCAPRRWGSDAATARCGAAARSEHSRRGSCARASWGRAGCA